MRNIHYTANAADVAAGFTPPFVVDYLNTMSNYGVQYYAAAGVGNPGTGTFQMSLDDPFNPPALGMSWDAVVMDANGRADIQGAVRAFRVLAPVLGDLITIVAQGIK